MGFGGVPLDSHDIRFKVGIHPKKDGSKWWKWLFLTLNIPDFEGLLRVNSCEFICETDIRVPKEQWGVELEDDFKFPC